jgi:hypothetical protein
LGKVERAYRKFEPKCDENKAKEKKERTPIMVRVSDVQREEVSWLWNDRIPRGKLTIIEGDPGEGKTFLSQAIAAAVTCGFGLPGQEEQREPETVLIMSAEDGLADTIRPRLEDQSSEVEKEAKQAGIAQTTLRRAKTTLGVKPNKASFGGGWTWSLPDRRCSSNPQDAHPNEMTTFGKNEHLRATEEGWEDLR